VVAAAWLVGVFLLGAGGAFRNDALPPRIPMALAATLLPGYLLLLSPTFRRIVATVPQHWLIGIQTFRILGGAWLVRYFAGQLPVFSRCRPGIGDVATALLAPFVAYAWYSFKPYARGTTFTPSCGEASGGETARTGAYDHQIELTRRHRRPPLLAAGPAKLLRLAPWPACRK
jgi:hypothetical protein